MSDYQAPYEAPYEQPSPIEDAYLSEQQFDQEIEQDFAPSWNEATAVAPSLEGEDEQLASELESNAMQSFDSTMNQAEEFDQTLTEG